MLLQKCKCIDLSCVKRNAFNCLCKNGHTLIFLGKGNTLIDFMFKRDVFKCWRKKGNILIGVLFKRDVFKCCCKKGNTLIDLLCKRNVFICCCRKGNILIVLCLKGIYSNVVAKKEMY